MCNKASTKYLSECNLSTSSFRFIVKKSLRYQSLANQKNILEILINEIMLFLLNFWILFSVPDVDEFRIRKYSQTTINKL